MSRSISQLDVVNCSRSVAKIVRLFCTMFALKIALFFVTILFCSFYLEWPLWVTLAAAFGVYLATGGWKYMKVVLLTLPRDLRYVNN